MPFDFEQHLIIELACFIEFFFMVLDFLHLKCAQKVHVVSLSLAFLKMGFKTTKVGIEAVYCTLI